MVDCLLKVFSIERPSDGQYFTFANAIDARFITLHIGKYDTKACMKIEFYGCKDPDRQGIRECISYLFIVLCDMIVMASHVNERNKK